MVAAKRGWCCCAAVLTFRDEHLRDGEANARRRAGNERELAGEGHGCGCGCGDCGGGGGRCADVLGGLLQHSPRQPR
jgi:hypothetical protein